MNDNHYFTALLFLLIVLIGQQSLAADPAGKSTASATKPKLVPRPVPGLPRAAAPGFTLRTAQTAPQTTASTTTQSTAVQARVIAIIRRSSFAAPATANAGTAEVKAVPGQPSQAAPIKPPAPGQVRILTKAEAAMLASKSAP